jgi:ABC-type multidrug transport system fused ATPase/permease subunit
MVPGERRLDQIEQVELDRVSYAYPDSDGPALIDVSLQLRPGTIVGVAGPSGSGKSTLAQILLRLRWPSSGQYRINGISAEEYSETSWRQLVAHVPQQPRLLHGSLAENVAFLDQTLSRARIAAALKAVGLGELEQSLPDGLDAELGPTGRNLSGGQIQRLGIARALARGPRMVILDEPTSALDVDAEKIVGDALEALRAQPDVLVIVIAHRPSTLAMCDRMVVLQEGRVAAFGGTDDVALNSAFLGRIWATERMGPRRSVAADKP